MVETYLETGEPVGSRTLSTQRAERGLPRLDPQHHAGSGAQLGLLDSPHISAGRVPTQLGLRLFVDGLLEVGDVSGTERSEIERSLGGNERDITTILDRAGDMLSGLTHGASLVLTPKPEAPVKHVEFVALGPDRALVVMVFEDGQVENRVFAPPAGLTPSALRMAANFLNAILQGRTLSEMRGVVGAEIARRRAELDALSANLIEAGTALWAEDPGGRDRLIVHGRANLLEGADDAAQLERIRELFDDLERKRDVVQLLELTEGGDGVRVFIGSENKLFSLSGSSLVVSPYMNADRKIIGAVGVIGPTRLNYGRIVPIVDYTAQLVGRLVSQPRLASGTDKMAKSKNRHDIMENLEEGFLDDPEAEMLDEEISDEAAEADEASALRAEVAELEDRLLRALADVENIRKRAERDRRDAEVYGATRFARDLLSVHDNFDRALGNVTESVRAAAPGLIEGIELTQRDLVNAFEKHKIVKIAPTAGERFDPKLHQAMFEAPVPGPRLATSSR